MPTSNKAKELTMEQAYAMGKTPLNVRMDRYILWFSPTKYIPIHPKEYAILADKASFKDVYRGLKILPLGVRI